MSEKQRIERGYNIKFFRQAKMLIGYDQPRLIRAPAAVRFEAKHIDQPEWIDPKRGKPTLMLFSIVDNRSGAAYQEYRCVYGEDAETALRFLFNAMTSKEDSPLQGIPEMIYLDNGPIAKSLVFQNMMERLGINWQTHIHRLITVMAIALYWAVSTGIWAVTDENSQKTRIINSRSMVSSFKRGLRTIRIF